MNDRLKYRAWDKPTKRLFEVWSFTPEYVYDCDEVNGLGFMPTNPAKIEDCVLEQCTGLKDKNGKLIYEGDIISLFDIDKGVIEWDKCQYQIVRCGAKLPMRLKYMSIRNLETERFVEVIGNIHENLELLEEQEK